MPISVRRDVASQFDLDGNSFRLRSDTRGFGGGSYLEHVRDELAEKKIRELLDDAGITWQVAVPVFGSALVLGPLVAAALAAPNPLTIGALVTTALATPGAAAAFLAWADNKNMQKRMVREMAREFGLQTQSDVDMFDDYWHMIFEGRKFKKDSEDEIGSNLSQAYRMLARVAGNEAPIAPDPQRPNLDLHPVTWHRILDASEHENYVVFSDHHMTNVGGRASRLNFFLRDNFELYLEVLDFYADQGDWCLVENGDVEECVIFEPDSTDAADRKATRQDLPVVLDDPDWEPFLDLRYRKRRDALARIFRDDAFGPYYDKIRSRFLGDAPRYFRLTGNHDTYSEEPFEETLLEMIRGQLPDAPLGDVLKIWRDDAITHVVMHGHQFDTVSIQHGNTKFALSCGEVFSEATAWTNEGPDRYWHRSDANSWVHGQAPFKNVLAREEAPELPIGDALTALAGLLLNATGMSVEVRRGTRQIVENLMNHEIGWEYYDNKDALNALGLEVLTGNEAFKFRHLNERELTARYSANYAGSWGTPSVILGHTHEPRHDALDPAAGVFEHYLNSGSAGRFRNLIWAVEVTPAGDRIVSWSRVGNTKQRRVWTPTVRVETFPQAPGQPPITVPFHELTPGPPEVL